MTAPALPCVRTRLLDLVARDPGMNKSDACRELGVAWGTVSHHVRVLGAEGLLEVEPMGREKALFPVGTGPRMRAILSATREVEARAILDALTTMRQAGLQELAERTGHSRKVVRRHLSMLLSAGLVANLGSGRPRYVLASRLMAPAPPRPTVGPAPFSPPPAFSAPQGHREARPPVLAVARSA